MSLSSELCKRLMIQRACTADDLQWTAADAQAFSLAASTDAQDYWYSGLVSLGEACAGALRSSFAWATIKAYYSTFYLSRAFLGFTGTSIEYIHSGSKVRHYVWDSSPGSAPTRLSGRTHDAVLCYVDLHDVVPLLRGQPIGADSASAWLIAQRNSANYAIGRFPDPEPTPSMTFVSAHGIRRAMQAYIQDKTLTYAFDPDHAILAYPVELARALISAEVPDFEDSEIGQLDALFRDSAGPLAFAKALYVVA